jgi:HEPN domain-containing protein
LSAPDHAAEARRWRSIAQEDLDAAIDMMRGDFGTPRHACLLAQQAAEKLMKAVLIEFQIEFPRTHDLDRLRLLLPPDLRSSIQSIDLAELSEWAVESRYPGEWPELGKQDAEQGVLTAQKIFRELLKVLS